MNIEENILIDRGVKPTIIRILVLRTMKELDRAFSLGDLENKLLDVDKSTLSRTIHLFKDNGLIHDFDDGSGSIKYSVCKDDCNCEIDDSHVHFYCNYCKKAFCLSNIPIPHIDLPEKLIMENVNLVIKGYGGNCKKAAT